MGRARRMAGVCVVAALPLLTSCANFFVPVTTSGGSSSGGGTTVGGAGSNYAYVLNVATSTVSGFLIGAGTLTLTPSSPYALSFVPISAVVSRANNFLYVAGPGAIYSFPINSNGSLSSPTVAAGVAVGNEISLAVSPDGQWLFGLNSLSSTLDEWQINQSTGAISLMSGATYTVTGATAVPLMVRVSPAGNYVFAALGTGGDHVFTLDTTTGAVASSQHLYLASALTSDNAITTDSTGAKLYIARSGLNGGVGVYTVGSAGALSSVSGSPFTAGQGPYDIAVNATDTDVYVANRADGTVSGFSVGSGGALTALSGSPYKSGSLVTSLVAERTGSYLMAAAAGGSPDVTLYGFDTAVAGKLDIAATSLSGKDPAAANLVALTH